MLLSLSMDSSNHMVGTKLGIVTIPSFVKLILRFQSWEGEHTHTHIHAHASGQKSHLVSVFCFLTKLQLRKFHKVCSLKKGQFVRLPKALGLYVNPAERDATCEQPKT